MKLIPMKRAMRKSFLKQMNDFNGEFHVAIKKQL